MFNLLQSNPIKWTWIFIAISIIGFIFQQMFSPNIWIFLAFVPAFSIKFPWMFVTSIFLHADLSHLFFNMFSLFFFGIYLEKIIGSKSFASLFIGSGIAGNIGYMLTTYNALTPSIGASGAVYGIIGTLTTLQPFMMIFVYGLIPLPMIALAVMYAFADLIGLFSPSGIAHGAHLAGMLIGVAYGLILRSRFKRVILENYSY